MLFDNVSRKKFFQVKRFKIKIIKKKPDTICTAPQMLDNKSNI